ncbi:uncharacterized protein LOC112057462 [Bicyclus anynana]|uniref:Uncharacterized protein LOC112057462 n=1 Tax=Bicyclus anynana TaxID=110368 RepID=A0ABM3LZ87_BICAN|nr:uncharacterized protein LOC112057462 [Bicyclus anynana]
MPPRKDRARKSDDESADESMATGSTVVTMTEQQLETIMTNIAKSQAETSRLLIENILATQRTGSGTSSPMMAPPAKLGSFAKCTARFDGTIMGSADEADVLEAFIDAVETYKECTNVSDDHALKGLPMLLTGNAAVWWRGVRDSTPTWNDALLRLRGVYGVPRPGYKIFREVFSQVHTSERADIFVSRIRALLSKLPYVLQENVKIDIVFGLLDRRIRKRVPRESVESIDRLMEKARLVEESLAEVSTVTIQHSNPKIPDVQLNPSNSHVPIVNPSTADVTENTYETNLKNSCSDSELNLIEKPNETVKVKRARPRCGFCKFFGHKTSDCRNRPRIDSQSDCQTPDRLEDTKRADVRCYGCGQLGTIRSKCDRCRKSSTSNVQFHSLEVGGADSSRPVVTVEIATHKGTATLDTGATHSIASPGLYKLLVQEGIQFTETHCTIGLADGTHQVRTALTCDTVVSLGTRDIPTSFIVFPDADNRTLLGTDFIIKANLILDLSRGTWSFKDKPQKKYFFTKVNDLHTADDAELMKVYPSQFTLRDDEGTRLPGNQKVQLDSLLIRKVYRNATDGPANDYPEHQMKVSESNASPPYLLSQNRKINDTRSRPSCLEQSGCDLCLIEVDLSSRSSRDIRENQPKDPTLHKIVEDLEKTDDPLRGRRYSDRGYVMSDSILYEVETRKSAGLMKTPATTQRSKVSAKKRQVAQKKSADEGQRPAPEYAVGNLVMLKTQGAHRGQAPKLIPWRDGPYRIKEVVSPTTYLLETVRNHTTIGKYHTSQLTAFIGDVLPPFKEKREKGRPRLGKVKIQTQGRDVMNFRGRM